MYARFAAPLVAGALQDTRVVLVAGPRQAGKTTLVRSLSDEKLRYFTLDDAVTLAAARNDPKGFIRDLDFAVLDEVQRAPDLLLAIKESVDRDDRPGRFLLTGSANLMTLPTVADSLAGRMEVISLLPLSQAELLGRPPGFLELAFMGRVKPLVGPCFLGSALVERVLAGGYPEALTRASVERRSKWYLDYANAIIQRDIHEIAAGGRLGDMPRFLELLAHYAAQPVNLSGIGASLGMDHKTVGRYLDILAALYLVTTIPPWLSNGIARLTKAPKLHFLDSGLLAALRGLSRAQVMRDKSSFGAVLESFVYGELLKQAGWLPLAGIRFHHFRTQHGDEVDLVLEDRSGGLVGLEVKASATVTAADFSGLRKLAAAAGHAFRLGAVLYDGDQAVPFGNDLWALPLSCLWDRAD